MTHMNKYSIISYSLINTIGSGVLLGAPILASVTTSVFCIGLALAAAYLSNGLFLAVYAMYAIVVPKGGGHATYYTEGFCLIFALLHDFGLVFFSTPSLLCLFTDRLSKNLEIEVNLLYFIISILSIVFVLLPDIRFDFKNFKIIMPEPELEEEDLTVALNDALGTSTVNAETNTRQPKKLEGVALEDLISYVFSFFQVLSIFTSIGYLLIAIFILTSMDFYSESYLRNHFEDEFKFIDFINAYICAFFFTIGSFSINYKVGETFKDGLDKPYKTLNNILFGIYYFCTGAFLYLSRKDKVILSISEFLPNFLGGLALEKFLEFNLYSTPILSSIIMFKKFFRSLSKYIIKKFDIKYKYKEEILRLVAILIVLAVGFCFLQQNIFGAVLTGLTGFILLSIFFAMVAFIVICLKIRKEEIISGIKSDEGFKTSKKFYYAIFLASLASIVAFAMSGAGFYVSYLDLTKGYHSSLENDFIIESGNATDY